MKKSNISETDSNRIKRDCKSEITDKEFILFSRFESFSQENQKKAFYRMYGMYSQYKAYNNIPQSIIEMSLELLIISIE